MITAIRGGDTLAQRSRLSSTLSGIAGEYYVAAELSRRGYVASLTLRNTRGVDLLVSNAEATRSVGIQVKTRQSSGREWMLTKKIEVDELAENLFFVFVSLNALERPSFHVVPRDVIVRYASENHQIWLRTPGKHGNPHRDNPMRKFRDESDACRDRWDILGLDAPEQPG